MHAYNSMNICHTFTPCYTHTPSLYGQSIYRHSLVLDPWQNCTTCGRTYSYNAWQRGWAVSCKRKHLYQGRLCPVYDIEWGLLPFSGMYIYLAYEPNVHAFRHRQQRELIREKTHWTRVLYLRRYTTYMSMSCVGVYRSRPTVPRKAISSMTARCLKVSRDRVH